MNIYRISYGLNRFHRVHRVAQCLCVSQQSFQHRQFQTGSVLEQLKVAVIGSGPAGFYTAHQLLKNPEVSVDIYEKFPVPFGLVRFGVAPDHQEVKNVINTFTRVAQNSRTRFIGNIDIGKDVTLEEIRSAYHAVVLCYGASQDRKLGIPGEDSATNVLSARRFVGWYNGIPADSNLEVDLDCDTAIIIGQGNVAIDCARILLLSREELAKTDITKHAFDKLKKSQIKKVYIVGRRGPFQAAYKIKEFREMTKLKGITTRLDFNGVQVDFEELNKSLPRQKKRLGELYHKLQDAQHNENCDRETIVRYFSAPEEILSDSTTGKVKGVRFSKTEVVDLIDENSKTIPASSPLDSETIPCGLVIRSIGYKSTSIDDSLPFDDRTGVIKNTAGRVENNPGLYCSGWAAFGATGVILNTMSASFEVGKTILEDLQFASKTSSLDMPGFDTIGSLLEQRNSEIVDFVDWQKIDEYERNLGTKEGKPREKLVSIPKILDVKDE